MARPKQRVKTATVCLPTSSRASDASNSFLLETSFNSNIDSSIRCEIERKFKESVVNPLYKFPRKAPPKRPLRKQKSYSQIPSTAKSRKRLSRIPSNSLFKSGVPSSAVPRSKLRLLEKSWSRPAKSPNRLTKSPSRLTKSPSRTMKSPSRTTKLRLAKQTRAPSHSRFLSSFMENPYRLPVQQKFPQLSRSFAKFN